MPSDLIKTFLTPKSVNFLSPTVIYDLLLQNCLTATIVKNWSSKIFLRSWYTRIIMKAWLNELILGVTHDAVNYVQRALLPDLSSTEAAATFARFIEESLSSWFTQVHKPVSMLMFLSEQSFPISFQSSKSLTRFLSVSGQFFHSQSCDEVRWQHGRRFRSGQQWRVRRETNEPKSWRAFVIHSQNVFNQIGRADWGCPSVRNSEAIPTGKALRLHSENYTWKWTRGHVSLQVK